MAIWSMRIACWITKATDTHSEYAIRSADNTLARPERKQANVPVKMA